MADTQYTKYYVAFLDILGFKDQVSSASCEDIMHVYDFLGNMSDIYFGEGHEEEKNNINIKIMSDSICVYINADIPNALEELVQFCAVSQSNLLNLDPCIFIRGGITYGDMYASGDTMFGPALTEAYLLEEKNAKVPRIIMRKSTLDHGKSRLNEKALHSLDYIVFRDDDAFYTLDYFIVFCKLEKNKEALERAYATVSHWLDTTIDESIRQKYLYVDKHLRKYSEEKTNA